MPKYKIISCHVLWRELCHFAAQSENVFDFHFIRQGLHDTPDQLRVELQRAIDGVGEGYDAVLVGYGLCCNGIEGITARKTKLVIMRGHDCITFLLGSKERYKEYFDRHPGTYWYSPGWIDTVIMPGKERHDKKYLEYCEKFGEDNARYLMETENEWHKKYSRATYVNLGFPSSQHFRDYTRKCAEWLGWEYDEQSGDTGLVVDFLKGAWDRERFLVVEPGQRVVATHDAGIIGAA
jgi:hypothetical protein